jgi:hypothetical protein
MQIIEYLQDDDWSVSGFTLRCGRGVVPMQFFRCNPVWVDENGNWFYVGHCLRHGEFVDLENNQPPVCPECKTEEEPPNG